MNPSVLSFQHLHFSCTLIRSSRKSITLSCQPDGTVLIRGPYALTEALARKAVEDHQQWLRQRQQKLSAAQIQPLLHNGRIRLLGKDFAIRRDSQAAFGEGWLCLSDRIGDEKAAIADCCRQLAMEQIDRRVQHYMPLLKVAPKSVAIGRSNSAWGSCKRDGCLRFSWKAVFLCPEDLDYLVVHELCHLQHFNHSKAFWRMVSTQFPDYQERSRRMDQVFLQISAQGWKPY